MVALTEEQKRALLVSTRESAAALLEDIAYMREVVARVDPSAGELRRMSGVLRRLLIDRDITKIAAPRIARFHFLAPDNAPYYKFGDKHPPTFFGSGGASAFDMILRAFWMVPTVLDDKEAFELAKHHPEATVELRLDGFLSQNVLCFLGIWISRAQVIKYVANKASGVHSDAPADGIEVALSRLRRVVTYSRKTGMHFHMDRANVASEPAFRYAPDAIDPALWELLCTMHFILKSEGTAKLEAAIRAELGT